MAKKVYVYAILFVTLMMIIGGSVSAFMTITDILFPSFYIQPFEEYARWQSDTELKDITVNATEETDDELLQRYEAMVEEEKRNSRNRAFNSLIKSFGWIIIPLPFFLIFKRKLNEVEKETD